MSASTSGIGRLPTSVIEESVESACSIVDCGHPDIVATVAVLGITVACLLLTGSVLTRLSDARDALATERTRTRAEHDAFEQFRHRIVQFDTMDSRPPDPSSGGGGALALAGGSVVDDTSLLAAQTAYRETVMATAHYEEEYDETLAENTAAEFSESIASALTDGRAFTPQLHAALVAGAERAQRERDHLLTTLDREEATLDAAEDALTPAARAVDELRGTDREQSDYAALVADFEYAEWHEERVESLLSDRQTTIHERESERPYWYDYLYDGLASPYPVLAAGTQTLSALADARDDLTSAASSR